MPKVLVIEDTPADIARAGKVLDATGASDVIVKSDGQSACHYLESLMERNEGLPGLILLDLELSRGSGFEVLRMWHSRPDFKKKTRIVVWTVMGETEQKICGHFGVDAIVPKWAGLDALENAIREHS
jgi:CheY-like chemotaxis protein